MTISRRTMAKATAAAAAGAGAALMPRAAAAAVTEQPASAILDVDNEFGGNIAAAVAEAERSGGPSAHVMLGKGVYDVAQTIHITKPISIRGGGILATRLRHAGAFNEPIFRADVVKRNRNFDGTGGGAPIPDYDPARGDGGLEIRDFSIIEDDRSVPNVQGIYLLRVDDMMIDNVQFGYLTGTALKLGADDADTGGGVGSGCVRESDFRRVRVYRCGSGSPNGTPDIPAFVLQNGAATGDGTNQNYFHNFRFVYNEGRMLIRGPGFGGSPLRRTIFRDSQIHALDAGNFTPNQFNPFDIVTLQGSVGTTLFDGAMVNGNRAGTAMFATKALGSQTPRNLTLRNINTQNIYGDLCRVDKCDSVTIDGGLGDIDGNILRVAPDSGLRAYHVHAFGVSNPAGKSTIPVGNGTVMWNGNVVQP